MRKTSMWICVGALSLFVSACSRNSSPASPSAPSGSPSSSAPAPALSGATIAGTVTSTGAASRSAMSFNARGAAVTGIGMTVPVAGTSISATVDAAGHFILQDVPSGDVTLAFTGSGIDARLIIKGVQAHDQIRITVNVSGNAARLEENEHDDDVGTELEGRVVSTNCGANPQTIVVGTRTPTTVNIQNARIHSGNTLLTCAQVQVNDRVEVHGTRNGTTLIATEVRIDTDHGAQRQPDHDDGDEGNKEEDEVKGVVAGAPAGHACPAFTFTVGTTTVTTTARTKFEHAMCAEVVNGMTVEAEGTKTGANALTATKVEIEDRSGRKH